MTLSPCRSTCAVLLVLLNMLPGTGCADLLTLDSFEPPPKDVQAGSSTLETAGAASRQLRGVSGPDLPTATLLPADAGPDAAAAPRAAEAPGADDDDVEFEP